MRQVSVLFINMTLPDDVFESAEAIQKAYEVIYETVRKLKGINWGGKNTFFNICFSSNLI